MSELAKDYADSMRMTIIENDNAGMPFGTDPDTGDELSAYDYLEDALDIIYSVGSDRQYRGARVCVGYGGPNVFIDTNTFALEVHWGSDSATRYLPSDFINGLDTALSELWEMGN